MYFSVAPPGRLARSVIDDDDEEEVRARINDVGYLYFLGKKKMYLSLVYVSFVIPVVFVYSFCLLILLDDQFHVEFVVFV